MRSLILATQEGICRLPFRPDGSLDPVERPFGGAALEAVSLDTSGTLYTASDGAEIYRSEDAGLTWRSVFKGFPGVRGLWSLAAHPVRPKEVYAGMEPVSLWISRDGGDHWDELTGLRDHPAAERWHFFDPMQPHVRAVAFDRRGERLCVGIEEGGVLISRDGGGSFEDKSQGIDEDVHAIQVAPDDPALIFAMTGGGLFRSRDGGHRWEKLDRGIDRWYMIPLLFSAERPNRLLLGAGNSPPPAWRTRGADAAIYRSEDRGERWELAEGPFPLRGMLSAIVADPGRPEHLFAGTTDGVLLQSRDGGGTWKLAVEELPRIEEMTIAAADL
jgi:photosystem II stability/assembly factor-like uncharacterized protein